MGYAHDRQMSVQKGKLVNMADVGDKKAQTRAFEN
jgi:hypothetical protein